MNKTYYSKTLIVLNKASRMQKEKKIVRRV